MLFFTAVFFKEPLIKVVKTQEPKYGAPWTKLLRCTW
jgi:hypothetical protein